MLVLVAVDPHPGRLQTTQFAFPEKYSVGSSLTVGVEVLEQLDKRLPQELRDRITRRRLNLLTKPHDVDPSCGDRLTGSSIEGGFPSVILMMPFLASRRQAIAIA